MAESESDKGFTVVDRRGGGAEGHDDEPRDKPGPAAGPDDGVDFTTFVMSLASSVLIHLGEIAEPGIGGLNLPLAKQTIDILGMLADKTRGNLTEDEARLLEHL